MSDAASFLGTEKIPKLLLKFSIPAMTGMMVNALYNVVDSIYVGNMADGATALAGVSVTMPFTAIVLALTMLFGIGGCNLLSIKLGEKNAEDAKITLAHTALALIVLGLILIRVIEKNPKLKELFTK